MSKKITRSGAEVEITNEGLFRKSFPLNNSLSKSTCEGQFQKLKKVNVYCEKEEKDCPSPIVSNLNLCTEPYSYDMELINGKPLDEFSFNDNDDEHAINITIKILQGLEVWHQADVLHHDLHSGNGGNVLIDDNENIKIIDPIASDTTNISSHPKGNDIRKCYTMIHRFIYPKISNSIKDEFNNSFLSESSKSMIDEEYDRYKDRVFNYADSIDTKEIAVSHHNKDIPSIIANLKQLL